MSGLTNDYTCWRSIDYRPAIAEIDTQNLLSHVQPEQSALDIGCNTGAVALKLARQGLSVLGIDINEVAVRNATQKMQLAGLDSLARFRVADIVEDDLDTFDVVVLIRLLTCLPSLDNWKKSLERILCVVRPNGIVYINDFVRDDDSPIYRERYQAASRLGWRDGNFAVHDAAGRLLFVAHHHSEQEIAEITASYRQIRLRFHNSLSMNGNRCRMFEFIGKKP